MRVAQAQKELFVNEALVLTDILLQPVVEGEATAPPTEPAAGATYIVASPAIGLFEGREGCLASWQQEQWIFVNPINGMCVFDANASTKRRFNDDWSSPTLIANPEGGTTIDTEARAAIAAILVFLRQSGDLPSS